MLVVAYVCADDNSVESIGDGDAAVSWTYRFSTAITWLFRAVVRNSKGTDEKKRCFSKAAPFRDVFDRNDT